MATKCRFKLKISASLFLMFLYNVYYVTSDNFDLFKHNHHNYIFFYLKHNETDIEEAALLQGKNILSDL